MPCRNPCRLTIHLTFTYILRWSLKRSVKLELGSAPPFSTNESAWSVMVTGSQSHVWSGPCTWLALWSDSTMQSVNNEWPQCKCRLAGRPLNPVLRSSKHSPLEYEDDLDSENWTFLREAKNLEWGTGRIKRRHNTHKQFPTWSMGLWNYASPPSLGLLFMEDTRPPNSRGNVCGFHLVALHFH